jgi:SpoVK/Ycf46/Vps4 family AAA+-type ATPase
MDISSALSFNGVLVKSGLICIDQGNVQFQEKLVAQPSLLDVIFREHQTIDDLIKFAIQRSAPAALSSEDFPHCEADLHLLKRYLVNVKQKGLTGVNVLLHGKPGVGKTELVRLIAQEIGMTVYEVGMTTDAGFAMRPKSRYGAYLFNQRYLTTNPHALILFDEIEDVIQNVSQMKGIESVLGYDKAWVNRFLESNPVPTFWIANRIERMDPAYLRRFDYVIEMRTPPRSVRRRILDRYLEGLPVSKSWLEHQAESSKIAPASIEKAARVIRHAGLTEQIDIEQNFERILRNSVEAQDGKSSVRYPDSIQYRLEYINTSINLKILPTSLQKVHKGCILLHGAPGTGKTAFAHYLAKELDRPLITRRASDLQSKWLGDAEKNIAKMFRDASRDDAMLLLDEADTFLQDRQQAKHSWEISQINELLTQMECYEGIFLCATNFMDHLDVASLRRFGLKVKFDYLTAEQRYAIFETLNNAVAEQPMDELTSAKAHKILDTLSNLTPGDFYAVRQRCGMLGESIKTIDLLDALKEESVIKPDGQKRTIGFTS